MNRSKDMGRPFVGSVADVLARTRRTYLQKTSEMLHRRRLVPAAVSARQTLYVGTAISNYDDNYATLALAGR
jgi:hypothetical protein